MISKRPDDLSVRVSVDPAPLRLVVRVRCLERTVPATEQAADHRHARPQVAVAPLGRIHKAIRVDGIDLCLV